MLASANYSSPLFWAVIVGWILSVTLHEFAHGIVAYWGGDYTIRERGGLTLNPFQYANPLFTFILPALFVLMGGIPLVGGATYIRVDLLRSKAWRSAVALAGPFGNLILFLLCAIPLHPKIGWIDPYSDITRWTSPQMFCAAMAVLQAIAVIINIMPVPSLDGFNAISSYLPISWQQATSNPQVRMGALFAFFFLLSNRTSFNIIFATIDVVLKLLGFDTASQEFIHKSYNIALFGST